MNFGAEDRMSKTLSGMILVVWIFFRMFLSTTHMKITRVTISAPIIDEIRPIMSVTAKPLTRPPEIMNRISAEMSVVMLESAMAEKALSYAASRAAAKVLPASISSRSRS